MKNKQKIFLFVDGSNLYGSSYKLFGSNKYIDFSLFIKNIEDHLKISFTQIHFYTSYSTRPNFPTSKEERFLAYESLFYKSVKNTKKVIFFKGYRSKTSGEQKEVDVKWAIDLVDFAHRKKFDQAFLFSSDADFMQALYVVQSLSIIVNVISMENRILYRAPLYYKTYMIQFNKNFSFPINSQWNHDVKSIFLNKKILKQVV